MQVEREASSEADSGVRVSNAWIICPLVGNNQPKGWLIPHKTTVSEDTGVKDLSLKDESASD